MENIKKQAKKWLCIAIVLLLLGMIVASAVQTSFGKVTIKKLYWETDEGLTMCANLFVPKGASAENKLPAIVTSHGTYNNKEMQDANFVELSRRGFIVLTIDCPLHGNSEVNPAMVLPDDPSKLGIWEGVLMLSRLPYVDTDRIGVTGHSRGGENCDYAVKYDNLTDSNLIASVLYNCYDATYVDADGNFTNIFRTRDVGIISCVFDEFFHRSKAPDGTTLWSPYFMSTPKAQSFLHFGEDPEGLETREAYTMYHQDIDGEDCVRIIYRPRIIHPWSHFSMKSTAYTIDFFTETLGAPNPIDSGNQVWLVKEFANLVSFIGLVIFMICFAILLCFTPTFADLRAKEPMKPIELDKTGKKWFWITLSLSTLFSGLIYLRVVRWGTGFKVSQGESMGLGLWSAFCGLFAILMMVLSYHFYGKKNGFDLVERGVKMPFKKLLKTILLSVIVICVGVSWVFFADYFFCTDFRFWTLALKTFNADKILATLPYLPLFLLFYIPASVAANSFNFVNTGKKKWVNLFVVALFVTLPALVLPWMQYLVYYNTNFPLFGTGYWFYVMYILWLFPIVLILSTTTIQGRIIYKATGNPYISGIIAGTIVALMTCINTMYVLVS